MTRFVLAALVLLSCAVFATELSAQSGQVTNPVPLTPPSVNTTITTCQTTCDVQNSCVPTSTATAASPGAATSSAGACNLSCTTQQLVCKQRC